ncbi:MAG: FHA domain-containing protein [Planctomycetes bacterium]|jgi:pSer/pThr/pTyr-binding forkhead associated (FHA) protein|nr:FHA domain-containing protein [Planctomycetota bacterium]MBT6540770.1 FHA domain-containing protein [Planctomycetota bacterium]MBT6783870.1 FHA domain-containing protein [Planctomycetota bacterium]MBT7104840.1 FHA domain-containing protein [Planctomycetota bacterium]MBT7129419.1 FHA domain-containing protein [Planctomycetota bacterium]
MSGRIRVKDIGRKTIVNITQEPITIGRDPGSRIVIEDRAASRKHGVFRWEGDAFVYQDLSSSNGSILHGQKVDQVTLSHGDCICIGDAEFLLELTDGALLEDETDRTPIAAPASAPATSSTTSSAKTAPTGPCLTYQHGGIDHWIPAVGRVVIGRAEEADVTIEDNRISSKHAVLLEQDGAWYMSDLGSGNGIVAGQQRVKKLELRNGVQFRIGMTEFTAKGFPAGSKPAGDGRAAIRKTTRSAANPAAEMTVGRSTRVDVGSQGSQGLFTISFILVLGVVLYSGYGWIEDLASNPDLVVPEGDRLSGAGHFEQVPIGTIVDGPWRLASGEGTLDVQRGDEAPQGKQWLSCSGKSDALGIFRLEYDTVFEVDQDHGLRLSARLQKVGFERIGFCVRWIESSDQGDRIVDEQFSSLKSSSNWSGHAAEFAPPVKGKGGSARVSLVALGQGSGQLLLDQLVVRAVETGRDPATVISAGDDEQKMDLAVDAFGVGKLMRGRQELISDLRVAVGPPRSMPWGQLLPVRREQVVTGDDGSIRLGFELDELGQGKVAIQQFARSIGWKIAASWTPQRPTPLILVGRIPGRRSSSPVQVFAGNKLVNSANRWADLQPCSGTEISIGIGKDQMVATFQQPMMFSVFPDHDGRGTLLMADAGIIIAGGALDVSFTASSEREQSRVLEALAEVERAIDARTEGDAARLIQQTRTDFPWRADVTRKLDQMEQHIDVEVNAALGQISAVLEDSEKFPGSPTGTYLERLCRESIARFRGLDPAKTAQEIIDQRKSETTNAEQLLTVGKVELLLSRAHDALGKNRFEIARFYFQSLLDQYPGTPGAAIAVQELKLIHAGGN